MIIFFSQKFRVCNKKVCISVSAMKIYGIEGVYVIY